MIVLPPAAHPRAMKQIDSTAIPERRRRLLRLVIQEYVRTAQPVGSQTIAQLAQLGVSSATIRNDLAALEADGMLTHPHTSAGRIPTEAGYRYFVHHLMMEAEPSYAERERIRGEFSVARRDMEQWLHVSTAALARTSQSAALATAPRSARSRYKHMELVAIHGVKVLLVLVLHDGAVHQQLLDLDQPAEQSELSKTSNALNDLLASLDTAAVRTLLPALPPFSRQVAMLVVEIMQRIESETSGHIYRDGLAQVLEAPEFSGGEDVRRIVQVLEQRSLLEQIVNQIGHSLGTGDDTVRVVIAGDGRVPELRQISLVLGRYGVGDQATGLLGIVGPMRMAYDRSVGAVRFVAGLMSEIVEETYGPVAVPTEPAIHPFAGSEQN
jgi:heat-inducible transcriptional repressor